MAPTGIVLNSRDRNQTCPRTGVLTMSLDRSLKGKSTLERHRNVLRRSERIVQLEDNEKWTDGKSSVFGLVKVAHRKQVAAKKVKVETVEGATATPVVAGAK